MADKMGIALNNLCYLKQEFDLYDEDNSGFIDLNELRLDQQAMLVGMAKGPSIYNPRRHPEAAKTRRDVVLSNMQAIGKLTAEDYAAASDNSLGVVDKPVEGKSQFPDFLDIVKRELWDETLQAYLASVAFVDAQIGRFLDALESNPRGRDTVIMLTSDHGWHLGEKKHWCKGAICSTNCCSFHGSAFCT